MKFLDFILLHRFMIFFIDLWFGYCPDKSVFIDFLHLLIICFIRNFVYNFWHMRMNCCVGNFL
jgi:hypothetical protein